MSDDPIVFPKWQPQLNAAIHEPDPAQLRDRIREVQQILGKRLEKILGSSSHATEIEAIEQAMDTLEVLKRKASQPQAS